MIIQNHWESEFFSCKIGEVILNEISNNISTTILQEAKNENYNLICFKLNKYFDFTVYGYDTYQSQRIMYKFSLTSESIKSLNRHPNITTYKGPIHTLYDLSIQAGKYSRFKLDKNFKHFEFMNLYKIWIEKSINNVMGDEIFCYNSKTNEPLGLITVKYNSKKDCTIGLISVSNNARGQKIGTHLINFVKLHAKKNDFTNLFVPTQENNTIANKFYLKNNFELDSQLFLSQVWLKKRG